MSDSECSSEYDPELPTVDMSMEEFVTCFLDYDDQINSIRILTDILEYEREEIRINEEYARYINENKGEDSESIEEEFFIDCFEDGNVWDTIERHLERWISNEGSDWYDENEISVSEMLDSDALESFREQTIYPEAHNFSRH